MSYYEDEIEYHIGQFENHIEDKLTNYKAEVFLRKQRIKNKLWRTGEGNIVPIKDLETSHLKNILTYIINGNRENLLEYIPIIQKELSKRKEF